MKMIRTLLAVFLLVLGSPTVQFAQQFDDYQLLKCSGTIPEGFLQPASDKYVENMAMKGGVVGESGFDARNQFFLRSSFFQQELKRSGLVLFNDPVSAYLNKVKDILLQDDPELKDKIQVYAMRSAVPNAFTTEDGTVIVGMGLLERLDTEAQLAFILSHEIQHYVFEHGLNKYIKIDEIQQEAKGNGFSRTELLEKQFEKSSYSREQEMEADRGGIELFLKSPFAVDAPGQVFDILKVCYLPYAEKPFDPEYFIGKGMTVPDSIILEEIAEIDPAESFDSLTATHPSLDTRKDIFLGMLEESGKSGGTPFLLSPEEFLKVRKIARFENIFNYTVNGRYSNALYDIYLTMEDEPESAFLYKCAAQSWYGLAKYGNRGAKKYIQPSYDVFQGQIQSLFYFTETANSDLLTLIAIEWTIKGLEKNPGDDELTLMYEDLVREFLEREGKLWQKEPLVISPDLKKSKARQLEEEYYGPRNVFAWKYRNFQVREKPEVFRTVIREKLNELYKYPDFVETMDSIEKAIQDPAYRAKNTQFTPESTAPVTRPGSLIGEPVSSVLVVNPVYRVIPNKKSDGTELLDGEKMTGELREIIKAEATKNNIKTQTLSLYDLSPEQGEVIDDVFWVRVAVTDYASGLNFNRVSTMRDELGAIMEKYDEQYLDFISIEREKTYSQRNRQIGNCICYTFVGYPIGLFVILKKTWTRTVNHIVLDTKTMDVKMIETQQYTSKKDNSAFGNIAYKYVKLKGKRR